MEILTLLKLLPSLLLNNWRWLLPTLAVAFAGIYGFHSGARHVQAEWDASAAIERQLTAAALERDRKAVQQRSEILEARLADQRAMMLKLNRRLSDEIKNSVYHACIVPDSGVSLLNDYRRGAPTR